MNARFDENSRNKEKGDTLFSKNTMLAESDLVEMPVQFQIAASYNNIEAVEIDPDLLHGKVVLRVLVYVRPRSVFRQLV